MILQKKARYKYKKNLKQRAGKAFIITGILIAALFMFMDTQMRPILIKTADYQCRVLATSIINNAVLSELDNELCDYSALITLRENMNGEIMSIESNMLNINRLKVRSTELINEAIRNVSDFEIYIPLGTVTGIAALYGRGPKLPVNIIPKGDIKTTLSSRFDSAGINQTLHQIIMEIEMDLSAVLPGFSQAINIKTEIIVAETVIVGNVPDTYLNLSDLFNN